MGFYLFILLLHGLILRFFLYMHVFDIYIYFLFQIGMFFIFIIIIIIFYFKVPNLCLFFIFLFFCMEFDDSKRKDTPMHTHLKNENPDLQDKIQGEKDFWKEDHQIFFKGNIYSCIWGRKILSKGSMYYWEPFTIQQQDFFRNTTKFFWQGNTQLNLANSL